jgi:hypothetical protein
MLNIVQAWFLSVFWPMFWSSLILLLSKRIRTRLTVINSEYLRIVYTSHAVVTCRQEQLADILRLARPANHAAGISGYLLYEQGIFAQWLEGPREAVETLWGKLQHDPRHYNIELLSAQVVRHRTFALWSMGISSSQDSMLNNLEGRASYHVAELPAILGFPDRILGLFDLLSVANARPQV